MQRPILISRSNICFNGEFMNKVLILYPQLFNCESKFMRKALHLLSNLDSVVLVAAQDERGFITRLAEQLPAVQECEVMTDVSFTEITHAIVFDDGEEFSEEMTQLKELGIPVRWLRISLTRVININKDEQYAGLKSALNYEYIGRGAYWGNPHSMLATGDDREEVIRKYQYDFDYDKFIKIRKNEVFKLAGKRLGCFCKPYSCHGDVLADFLNAWDDGF